MKIALGSTRTAKVEALRTSIIRIAEIDSRWRDGEILSLEVDSDVPAMPLNDEELMRGAKARAIAVRNALRQSGRYSSKETLFCVGLEGGFHTIEFAGERLIFLRGWAYVSDGERESFGASPSVLVPDSILRLVVEGNRELGEVIDEVAGQFDVRSRQGAWGVLSKDLFTRAMSFETALLAAFAPFYNANLYR